ncbi:hypothetical protein BE11_20735 [Sorangium cellulosum]|nr:hypothetical protein BE11_20735 [Sorangium cellulosum]
MSLVGGQEILPHRRTASSLPPILAITIWSASCPRSSASAELPHHTSLITAPVPSTRRVLGADAPGLSSDRAPAALAAQTREVHRDAA